MKPQKKSEIIDTIKRAILAIIIALVIFACAIYGIIYAIIRSEDEQSKM